MARPSRISRKNRAEMTTSLVNLSLEPLMCIKNSATSVALIVAITSATAALKRPKSKPEAYTVRAVPTSKAIQIATYVLSDDDVECSDMQTSRVTVNQIKQGEQVDPNDVHKVPVQASHFNRSVVLRSEPSLPGHDQQPQEDA